MRKHAVTSAGGTSYGYDANGNMSTRNGATIGWTSYNLPASLSASGYTASFNYAPDRSRWRQVATYTGATETTIYVAGLVEKLTTSARVHWKHRIAVPAGEVQVIRRSDGTNDVFYITTDHLGSTDTVTDASATVLARESFGAWGARRAANWQGSPSPGEWQQIANTTRRGYTGHEQLDNVLLVHMNGRVYDPAIGRFMSADPYVDGADTTQEWNRYGYVGNRPMVLTDPSGYTGADGKKDTPSVKPVAPPPYTPPSPNAKVRTVLWFWDIDFYDPAARSWLAAGQHLPVGLGSGNEAGGGGGSTSSVSKQGNWDSPCSFDDPKVGESEIVDNVGTSGDIAELITPAATLAGVPKDAGPAAPWPQATSFLSTLGGQGLKVLGRVGQGAAILSVGLEVISGDPYGAFFAFVDVGVYTVLGGLAATGPATAFSTTEAALVVGATYYSIGGAEGIATNICNAVSN